MIIVLKRLVLVGHLLQFIRKGDQLLGAAFSKEWGAILKSLTKKKVEQSERYLAHAFPDIAVLGLQQGSHKNNESGQGTHINEDARHAIVTRAEILRTDEKYRKEIDRLVTDDREILDRLELID